MSIQSNQPTGGATVVAKPPANVAPAIELAPRKSQAESKSSASTVPDAAATTRQVAADMEKQIRAAERNLQFQVDDGTGIIVVRVVDAVSGDVIRQIPNEEFLRLARNVRALESDVSCIVDECA
jgi:flagellar protein FlaG